MVAVLIVVATLLIITQSVDVILSSRHFEADKVRCRKGGQKKKKKKRKEKLNN